MYSVRKAVMKVAIGGGESPSLYVERVKAGERAVLLMTVGVFANIIRLASHKPGTGPLIDWSKVSRESLTGENVPSFGSLTRIVVCKSS